MSKKLIVALSAAVISAKMAGAATVPYGEATLDDLENLIDANNLSAIKTYLVENEALTLGETPLALTARMILEGGSFMPESFNFDETWYRSRYKARSNDRYKRQLRKRIRAYRKWKRHHIY